MHTPSITFGHLALNSARTGYVSEGTLCLRAAASPPPLGARSERCGQKQDCGSSTAPDDASNKMTSISIPKIWVLSALA